MGVLAVKSVAIARTRGRAYSRGGERSGHHHPRDIAVVVRILERPVGPQPPAIAGGEPGVHHRVAVRVDRGAEFGAA
ncbi:MAG: hypothetical protein ACYC1E_16880, partial [Propionibacteriaceae bacterium]